MSPSQGDRLYRHNAAPLRACCNVVPDIATRTEIKDFVFVDPQRDAPGVAAMAEAGPTLEEQACGTLSIRLKRTKEVPCTGRQDCRGCNFAEFNPPASRLSETKFEDRKFFEAPSLATGSGNKRVELKGRATSHSNKYVCALRMQYVNPSPCRGKWAPSTASCY